MSKVVYLAEVGPEYESASWQAVFTNAAEAERAARAECAKGLMWDWWTVIEFEVDSNKRGAVVASQWR